MTLSGLAIALSFSNSTEQARNWKATVMGDISSISLNSSN